MRNRKLITLLICLTLLTTAVMPVLQAPALAADYSTVRVRLSNANDGTLNLGITGNYMVEQTGQVVSADLLLTAHSSKFDVAYKNGGGTLFSGDTLRLVRQNDSSFVKLYTTSGGNRSYLGDLLITISGGEFNVVNYVPIEQYLYGVVAYEMNNDFPLEALKSQAVCARNYVIGRMSSSKKWDLGDTSNDQVYRGYDSSLANVIAAVDATRGQVLKCNGEIITAYFGASNGGQTEKAGNPWRNDEAFTTIKDDPYDIRNPETPMQKLFFPSQVSSATPLSSALTRFIKDKAAQSLSNMGYSTYSDQIEIIGITSLEAYEPKYEAPSKSYTRARATVALKAVKSGTSAPVEMLERGPQPSAPVFTQLTDGAGQPVITNEGPLYYDQAGNIVTSNTYLAMMAQYEAQLAEWQNGVSVSAGTSGMGMTGQVDQLSVDIDFAIYDLKNTDMDYKAFTNKSLIMYYSEPVNGGFYLVNGRYGHGVGMSQRGAQQMANEGMDYRQILDFYYVNCTLTTIDYAAAALNAGTFESMVQAGAADDGDVPDESGELVEQGGVPTASDAAIKGTAARSLTLYSAPSGSVQTAVLSEGAALYVIAEENGWYCVADTRGNIGYMPKSDVVIDTANGVGASVISQATVYQAVGGAPAITLGAGEPVVLTGSESGYYQVFAAGYGLTGWVNQSDVSLNITKVFVPTDPQKRYGKTKSDIKLYKDAKLKKSIADIPAGFAVEILARTSSGKAYKAVYDGKTGYVAKDSVSVLKKGSAHPSTEQALAGFGVEIEGINKSANTFSQLSTELTVPNTNAGNSAIGEVKTSVNLRSRPSTSSERLTVIYKGEEVTVLGQTDSFYKIQTSYGTEGYVAKDYVDVDAQTNCMAISSVKIRQKASRDSETLGVLYKGETARVLDEDGEFLRMRTDSGIVGYIAAEYAKKESSLPVVGKDEGGSSGSPSSSGSSKSDKIAAVGTLKSDVNLREQPSTSSGVVKLLEKGTKINIYAQNGDFYRTKVDGAEGYVSRRYVTNIKAPSGSSSSSGSDDSGDIDNQKLGIAKSKVRARSSEGTELYSVPKNDIVLIIGSEGSRFKVKYNGSTGYIEDAYIAVRSFSKQLVKETVRIRKEPSTDSEALGKASGGSKVVVVSESGEWTKIYSGGINGYVKSEYLA